MSVSFSLLSRRALGAAGIAVALATIVSAAPAAAASANHTMLEVGIDDCVIRGSNGPMHGKVTVERRSADGTLLTLETVSSDFGYFGTDVTDECFQYGAGAQPGDVIKTTVKGDSRTFVVPRLTVRVDRDTDKASGVTDPNGKLLVGLVTTGPGSNAYPHKVRVAGDGSYEINFRKTFGVNVRGWDEVDVAWTDARGDRVFNSNVAPGVEVLIDRPTIWTAGQAGSDSSLKLLDGPGGSVVARTGGVVYAGKNVFLWLDSSGEPVAQHEGDRVVTDVASDASFTIPTLATTINKRTDRVTIDTGLGGGLLVNLEIHDANPNVSFASLTTDSSGRVSVDFTDDGTHGVQWYDIVTGSRLSISLRMNAGDLVDKTVFVE